MRGPEDTARGSGKGDRARRRGRRGDARLVVGARVVVLAHEPETVHGLDEELRPGREVEAIGGLPKCRSVRSRIRSAKSQRWLRAP